MQSTPSFGRPSFADWHSGHSRIGVVGYADAASCAELIVNATNGSGTMPALEQAGKKNLGTKVLRDIANPLDFSKGRPAPLFVCNTDSLGEQIQRAYLDLKVVNDLNTNCVYYGKPCAASGTSCNISQRE